MLKDVTLKFPDQHLPEETEKCAKNGDQPQSELHVIGFTEEAVTMSHHAYVFRTSDMGPWAMNLR